MGRYTRESRSAEQIISNAESSHQSKIDDLFRENLSPEDHNRAVDIINSSRDYSISSARENLRRDCEDVRYESRTEGKEYVRKEQARIQGEIDKIDEHRK